MKFCPVVPEICRGHVHVAKKERRRIIIIIISNGAKTISLQTTFGKLNYSCHMKSCLFSAKKNPNFQNFGQSTEKNRRHLGDFP
jgi:hypothetical protein